MNYKKEIPAPVITVLAENLPDFETHDGLDNLFLHANAPGTSPEGSKPVKTKAWLRRINRESENPLKVLGKLIECYVEIPSEEEDDYLWDLPSPSREKNFKDKLLGILSECNLQYISGGIIADGQSLLSKSLSELIKKKDIPAIDAEFTRALKNVNSEPREAVSAASNILESIFKIYINDRGLDMPKKQDIQGVWKVVREDLGFDPSQIEDEDLKTILSGMISTVKGIGALRTHASSAHGQGRKLYQLKPRHAKLAVNAAHTLAIFILETWEEKY